MYFIVYMNNKIILVTGSDDSYIENQNFKNYLKSINSNSNFDRNILIYLSDKIISPPYDNIEIYKVDPKSIKSKNPNNCIQHGEFLNASEFDQFQDSDIIFFTDGDITLQRNMTEKEMNLIRNFVDDDIFIGYNEHPNQMLFTEAGRLAPYDDEWNDKFNDLNKIKCYNSGVLCMNKKTWKRLCNLYVEKFEWINNIFQHYAKQQFLISYIIGTEKFHVTEMGYDIHNHSIYHLPIGSVKGQDGLLKYNGNIVLFKHKWY